MKLWHQARTEINRLPAYRDAMVEHFKKVGDPNTTVDLHGVAPNTYKTSYSVGDNQYNYFTYVHSLQVLNNCMRAEREGYDGFMICNLPERVKEECQSLVDIPVVSSAQASMYAAAMLGEKFAILTMNDELVPVYEKSIRRYGMETRSWGVTPIGVSFSDVFSSYEDQQLVVDAITKKTRELALQGVDVIIPGEAPVCSLLSTINFRRVDDIPIVDTLGVTLKFTESLVRLREDSGMYANHVGFYGAKPPADRIKEVQAYYHLDEVDKLQ